MFLLGIVILTACNRNTNETTTTTETPTDTSVTTEEIVVVEKPKQVQLTDGFISWLEVDEVDYYEITVDNQLYQVTRPLFNLNELDVTGRHQVEIRVAMNGKKSAPHQLTHYFSDRKSQPKAIYDLFWSINQFSMDLPKEYFSSEKEYQDYLHLKQIESVFINDIALYLSKINISADQAVIVLQELSLLLQSLQRGDVQGITEIIEKQLEMPHFSYRLAYLLTNVLESYGDYQVSLYGDVPEYDEEAFSFIYNEYQKFDKLYNYRYDYLKAYLMEMTLTNKIEDNTWFVYTIYDDMDMEMLSGYVELLDQH